MRSIISLIFLCLFTFSEAQTLKSKNLKLKYNLPESWSAEEFGGKNPWEESQNLLCNCAGAHFTKSHADGKMHVVIYTSTLAGLDSTKRKRIGNLEFVDVLKYDRVRNNDMSLERKKSNFIDLRSKAKSFDCYRYFTKVEDHFFIIYAWQENMNTLNSTNEKDLFQMVNSIFPN